MTDDGTVVNTGTYRVLLVGTALARDTQALYDRLVALRKGLWEQRRPLVVVFDNYPSGLLEVAVQATERLGVECSVHEPTKPMERLIPDVRWSRLIEQGYADLVLCVTRDGSVPYHQRTLDAAEAREIPVMYYDEVRTDATS